MSAAKSMNRAHAALVGIESKNGFLGEETLIRLVQAESFLARQKRYSNDHLRSMRDSYRELSRQIEKLSRKNLASTRVQELTNAWMEETIRYLGYSEFTESSISHWSNEGNVVYLRSPGGKHSVGVFFYNGLQQLMSVDEQKVALTGPHGESTFETARKESLCEQIEQAMDLAELPEAILVTPHFWAYFRADSKITGSCLEVRLEEIFRNDDETSAILASSIFHADFYEFSSLVSETESSESESEDSDSEVEDGGESSATSSTTAQTTPSQVLFQEDLEQARRITEDLHKQVMLALEILGNERIEVDPDFKRRAISVQGNEAAAAAVFKDGLFVLYRILFILYAEARRVGSNGQAFLPVENAKYSSFYSLEHLRDWSEEYLKKLKFGEADGQGTYLWNSLKTIFTLLRRGVRLTGDERVSAYNGQLFSSDQAPTFDYGPSLRDGAMARVLVTLSRIGGDDSSRRLHFGNLGIEQLGSVYEALLAQKPVIVREKSCWVQAHPTGVGLVTVEFAKKMGHIILEPATTSGIRAPEKKGRTGTTSNAKGQLETYITKNRPAYILKPGLFVVAPLGGQKKQTASHYTPPKLAEFLVKRTLKPLVEGKSSAEILSLRIVEPAVGSGGFLIAAIRYLAPQLLEARIREGADPELRGREPTYSDRQRYKREILENCLFGVDINPLSIELCRTSLYLEALVPGQPLPFLHHRLKSGNALVYADLLAKSRASFGSGVVPNNAPTSEETYPALFDLPIEAMVVEKNVWGAWDQTRVAYGKKPDSKELTQSLSARIKELKIEKKQIREHDWINWALKSQHAVTNLLRLSKKAISEFEKLQRDNQVVDELEARFKDRLGLIPDMDPVIIEAEGVKVDARMERQRREALIRERGQVAYSLLVKNQRAFMRLKALADLHCSLWLWPVDLYDSYPSHADFQELVNWLLNEKTLDRKSKPIKLSNKAFGLLKNSVQISKREKFFQWHVEFAQVFGEQTPGFSAVISNPPWKVVGTKDKEVYPSYDPYFLKTAASQKAAKIKIIHSEQPRSAEKWLRENFVTKCISKRWQSGIQSEMPTSGKNDLSTLFCLKAERLVREPGTPHRSRIGLLVSRSAVFVNGGTKSLRERFFKEWGLQEATSFVNLMDIFSIDSRVEFTCLVGEPGKKTKPRFVHGVVDPNQLDTVSSALEAKNVKSVVAQHKPIDLDIEVIGKCFARETLAIPGLTDPRQMEIAAALHQASGPVVYLDQIETTFVGQGINQKTGPQKGISEYAENIPPRELPKWEDVLAGKVGKWVPLIGGSFFNTFTFDTHLIDITSVKRFGKSSYFSESDIELNTSSVVWRCISQINNQRTLIVSQIPSGVWFDHSCFSAKLKTELEMQFLERILGSITSDFLIRSVGSTNMTLGIVSGLPISNYKTQFQRESLKLRTESEISCTIDALMWLHYGQNKGALNRENLIWMLDTQFDCLKRNNPDYIRKVIEAFDHYSKQKDMYGADPTPIFKLKSQKVVDISDREISLESKSKKKKRA